MKVLIVEDEYLAAENLKVLLTEIDSSIEVVDILDSIKSTVQWLDEKAAPELIFFDIHLADGSCFEIFKQKEVITPVIFTTAYDQYAIQAFKVNSIDYLLKPIRKEDIEKSLKKFSDLRQTNLNNNTADTRIEDLMAYMKIAQKSYQSRFIVKAGSIIKYIPVELVAYLYTEDRLVILRTIEGRKYHINHTLDELEEMLDPDTFTRLNRQFICSLKSIEEIYPYFKGRLKIKLNPSPEAEVIVSSERAGKIKEWLNQ